MRRNNDWLALLAVSVALSILRHSLAGERHPLDYDTAELPVNGSRTVYESRESTEPSVNSPNRPNTPFPREISDLPSTVAQTPSDRPYVNRDIVFKGVTKTVSPRATNLLDNDDFDDDASSLRKDLAESGLENPAEPSRNPRTTESGVPFAGESTGLGLEVAEQPSLSPGSRRAAIKDTSRLYHATQRRGVAAWDRKTTTEGTIRGGSESLDHGHPYYGHVGLVSRDYDSLTTSGRQARDVGRRRGTRDPRGETGTSDKGSGSVAKSSWQGDVASSKSSIDHVKEERTEERYLTGYSVLSVPFNRGLSGKSKTKSKSKSDKLIAAGRSKDRRASRSVYNRMSDRSRLERSTQSSRKKLNKSRISDRGDAIDLETWFFSRDSKLSNDGPRKTRLDSEGSQRGSYNSSGVESSRHGAPSHNSTPVRREAENARELNGISLKRRSTTRDDDLEDKGARHSSPAPGEDDFTVPSDAVASDSTSREEASWDVNLRETSNSPLANKTASRVENIDEELELSLPRNNLTDGDNAKPVASAFAFNNESDSTIRNESSIDKIGLNEARNNETSLTNPSVAINPRLNPNNAKLNNESVSGVMDEMESDASWAEIDEMQGAINTTWEETSAPSNATEEPEKATGNSLRDSIAAQRNATYLRRDINSLAEGSSVSKSNGLFQFDERNANDPLRNSSTMEQGRKTPGNPNGDTQPEQSTVYNEEQSKWRLPLISFQAPNVSESVAAGQKRRNREKIANEASPLSASPESSDPTEDSEAKKYRRPFNRSLIEPKDGNPVNPRPMEPLNQNTGTSANKIRANGPITGSSVKNERHRNSSLHDRTTDTTNPAREGKKSSNDPQNPASKRLVSSGPVTSTVNNRPSRERKSRSSSVGNSTPANPERDSTSDSTSTGNSAVSETSTSMGNKDEVRQSVVPSLKIDLSPPKVSQGILESAGVTLNGSWKFVSVARDRSTVSVWTEQATVDPADDSLVTTEIAILSTDLVDQFPNETSTVPLINDDEQAFAFDTVVTSTKTTDEGLVVTIDDMSSRDADNSSRELEPPNQWPVKHSAVVEGDLVLGGLMMVHEREDTITCGPVMPQGGVQALEAMLYTLDRLNDREIVPGVKIGAHILDDCDKDTYGLEMAVDFIKGTCVYQISG
ncbi:PREDICTED: uncharacterized protein LOC108545732 [Eufriesea mexicana]|uniref:uncharacterized protein LOC108545732 n=1 Tax=Eufriesea mexicana TaxID=516756 RepID=UPI00083BEF0A|nr:PREDICTED: uncharacterized protein LOC108545732 [Eufriesea mexicana]